MKKAIIDKLKRYFRGRQEVALAFLFGSQASGRARSSSDWDIGLYFKPVNSLDLETTYNYPHEDEIRRDVDRLIGEETEVVVLNRARPSLVFQVLNSGEALLIRDRRFYLRLLLKTHYEAVDFWGFVDSFWRIRSQAASLTPEARALLIEHLTFLENEFADLKKFQNLTWKEYIEDRDQRRNVERWIENLVMNALDIAKIVLASEKQEVPPTYRETLRAFAVRYLGVSLVDDFSNFADLRNIVSHEYLDLRWERIKKFIKQAGVLYPVFIKRMSKMVE